MVVSKAGWNRIKQRLRATKQPSSGWIAAAWTFVGIAISSGVVYVTLPGSSEKLEAWVRPAVVIIAIASAVIAVICFLAHKNVNDGRKDEARDILAEMETHESGYADP